MRVIISEAAWTDLYRIGAAIAQDNRARAVAMDYEAVPLPDD